MIAIEGLQVQFLSVSFNFFIPVVEKITMYEEQSLCGFSGDFIPAFSFSRSH